MLHGEVKVNDGEIARWTAVRKERVDCGEARNGEAPPFFRYECTLWYRNLAGYPMEAAFDVTHRYGDGAVLLAHKVLMQGYGKLRVKPMVSELNAALYG